MFSDFNFKSFDTNKTHVVMCNQNDDISLTKNSKWFYNQRIPQAISILSTFGSEYRFRSTGTGLYINVTSAKTI